MSSKNQISIFPNFKSQSFDYKIIKSLIALILHLFLDDRYLFLNWYFLLLFQLLVIQVTGYFDLIYYIKELVLNDVIRKELQKLKNSTVVQHL